jgi:hypothetical protein
MSSDLTAEDRENMALAIGNALGTAYGMAAATLAQPLAIVMQTLEDMGALCSPTGSVVTEAETVATEAPLHAALVTIRAVCEARELMRDDQDADILTILGVCNRHIGESGVAHA